MYRVKKLIGRNKYKVQIKTRFMFWVNVKGAVFDSQDKAFVTWANLTTIELTKKGK